MKKAIIAGSVIVVLLAIVGGVYRYISSSGTIKLTPPNKSMIIVVTTPIKDSQISSPLSIAGRARGNWFFEGSFPVLLLDSYGNTIAQGHVTAQGEWMTQDFVKFVGTLQFDNFIKGSKGTLILKKDNPSDTRQFDDSIEIPVTFK